MALSMLVIGTAGETGYADSKGPGSSILIELRNYARIDEDVLREAGTIASYVFRKAGVDVIIVEQSGVEPARPGNKLRNPCHMTVNILPPDMSRRMGLPMNALGLAPGSSVEDDRTTVYVFGDVAKRLAGEQEIADMRYILGHAVAHEIGHVLLNVANHSHSGIMQATWREKDFRAMTMGKLKFGPEERERIQAEVLRRNERRK
jgi:hypothetical protein